MPQDYQGLFYEQLVGAHQYLFCRETDNPPLLDKCSRCSVELELFPPSDEKSSNENYRSRHTFHMKASLVNDKLRIPALMIINGIPHAVFEYEGRLCDQCVVDFHKFLKRE